MANGVMASVLPGHRAHTCEEVPASQHGCLITPAPALSPQVPRAQRKVTYSKTDQRNPFLASVPCLCVITFDIGMPQCQLIYTAVPSSSPDLTQAKNEENQKGKEVFTASSPTTGLLLAGLFYLDPNRALCI